MTTQNFVIAAADTAQTTAQTSAPKTAATVEIAGKGGFTGEATVGQLMEFQLTGLLVVFVVLGAITVVSMFSSWLLKIIAPGQYFGSAPAPAPALPAAAKAATATTIHPGLPNDKLLAILAAAAETALGQSVTIVSFATTDSNWSAQGRIAIHSSHRL
jgi:hypothetical protein